jgi:hypothetical protein
VSNISDAVDLILLWLSFGVHAAQEFTWLVIIKSDRVSDGTAAELGCAHHALVAQFQFEKNQLISNSNVHAHAGAARQMRFSCSVPDSYMHESGATCAHAPFELASTFTILTHN